MANEQIQKFVELHAETEQLLNNDKIQEAKQKYLDVINAYQSIEQSSLDHFHKEIAHDQVTKLFKKVNDAKARVKIPYNLIAAAALIIAFSFVVFLNPEIVGLVGFEDLVRQPVDITFTESGLEQVTLRNKPLTLSASGELTGHGKLYYKKGEKLELIFDSAVSPVDDNGKFVDVCEETCDLNTDSNAIELFAQVDDGSTLKITELSYKVQRTDNSAPAWKGTTRTFTATRGTPLTLNLDDYFEDPENDPMVYLSTTAEGIDVSVQNSEVTITAQTTGSKQVTFIASDLLALTKIGVTINVQ